MGSRLAIVFGVLGLGYGALLFRLYDLQIESGKIYIARAGSQVLGVAPRGSLTVTDRNGNTLPIATTKNMPQIYAVPKAIEDASETAHALAPILNLDPAELAKRLQKPSSTYELLVRRAPSKMSSAVSDLKLKGVYAEHVPERFYPFGTLAAHLVGYVGPNGRDAGELGLYGLEKQYEESLAGKAGRVEGQDIIEPQAGGDIALSIDPNVQIEAERILGETIAKHRAQGGSVIVEDPKTGRILAMGSWPTFNPNEYFKAKIGNFLNPAVQAIYEPGSVMKVITMAAGIDSGAITPETTYEDTGVLMVSGRKIQNWDLKAHGTVTMTTVIEKSLNTGAAFAERKTGNMVFLDYLKKFGFGEKTGIDVPGELAGDLRRLHPKAPAVAFATASFGQGVAVTPIELVNAASAIANGGVLMRPVVNAAQEPKVIRRVIGEEAARQVTRMMISAVDKAEVAKVDRYSLAGKTGTAQVPDFKRGGYSDEVVHTYVGFGPTANPRFVILLKIDKPEGAPLAGQTVVSAFRDLAQFLLNYYNIPPDRPEKK